MQTFHILKKRQGWMVVVYALIPALGKQRQENLCEFKATYSWTARTTQ
jgi:hypothetical protein